MELKPTRYLLLHDGTVIGGFHEYSGSNANRCAIPHAFVLEKNGHCFTYIASNGESLRQVTPFVTHTRREMLVRLLEFRNKHVDTPYVHKRLLSAPENVIKRSREAKIRWPVIQLSPERMLDEQGCLTLHALDKNAYVQLRKHERSVDISYMIRIFDPNEFDSAQFTWITQHYPVNGAPKRFKYPIQLLVKAWATLSTQGPIPILDQLNISSQQPYRISKLPQNSALNEPQPLWSDSGLTSNEILRICNSTSLPASFLNKVVKVEWNKDATYFMYQTPRLHVQARVDIDGSVIDYSDGVFEQVTVQDPGQVHRYTTEAIPPSSCFLNHNQRYILSPICAKLIGLYDIAEQWLPVTQPMEVSKSGKLSIVERREDSMGIFTAYNDRTTRVVFQDRTLLELRGEMCKLILPTGESKVVLTKTCPLEEKEYVMAALGFSKWAFSSAEEREAELTNHRALRQAVSNALIQSRFLTDANEISIDRALNEISQRMKENRQHLEETKHSIT